MAHTVAGNWKKHPGLQSINQENAFLFSWIFLEKKPTVGVCQSGKMQFMTTVPLRGGFFFFPLVASNCGKEQTHSSLISIGKVSGTVRVPRSVLWLALHFLLSSSPPPPLPHLMGITANPSANTFFAGNVSTLPLVFLPSKLCSISFGQLQPSQSIFYLTKEDTFDSQT